MSSPNPARFQDAYRLDESLGFLVNEASRSIRRRFDRELAAGGLGVTGEQCSVMVHLWRRDGQHQKDLAATLAKDKTTMARLVQGLEARGMVNRVSGEADRRHKRVYLTELGRTSMEGLTAAAATVLAEVSASVDSCELAVCKKVLRAVNESLTRAEQANGGGEK